MEKRISELMDCIQDDTVDLRAEGIASAERIKEATMRKIDNSSGYDRGYAIKRRSFKTLVGIAAAAALLVALCGAAYAANTFGVREYFREMFARSGQEMSQEDIEVLENIGANEMPSVTSEGTTMTVTAAVYDGQFYYLALKIVAPENVVLECGESFWQLMGSGENWPEEMLSLTGADGEEISRETSIMFSDDTPGDNEMTVVIQIISQFENVFGNGEPKILSIPGVWLQTPDKEYTQVLWGTWEFDIEACGVSGSIPGAEPADEVPYVPSYDKDGNVNPTPMGG